VGRRSARDECGIMKKEISFYGIKNLKMSVFIRVSFDIYIPWSADTFYVVLLLSYVHFSHDACIKFAVFRILAFGEL